MISETTINWKSFEYKYYSNLQNAFENLTYYLFCHEFNRPLGIFRYFDQPNLETEPIRVGEELIGFQSKYYQENVSMSSKADELKNAIVGAVKRYSGLSKIYFYIGREFGASTSPDHTKPVWQQSVDKTAEENGVELVWKSKSCIEAQLMTDCRYAACRNVFFQVDSVAQKCCECFAEHRDDIFRHIHTSVSYKNHDITLAHNRIDLKAFLKSDKQILLVDGEAGSGKSALVKRTISTLDVDNILFAFKTTDLDVRGKLQFLNLFGQITFAELNDIYADAHYKILYIDAAEKYFLLENQQTFADIMEMFSDAGWKLILTVRSAYCESFHNALLQQYKVANYHVVLIDTAELAKLSSEKEMTLPTEVKLRELLSVPFYLGLYLGLGDMSDNVELTWESFRTRIWDDIIRVNMSRKSNMPSRREAAVVRLTMDMVGNERYTFPRKNAELDTEALEALEQDGIIFSTADSRNYCLSHDVFEELIVEHIFTERLQDGVSGARFFEGFSTSLRCRRLFRVWLDNCFALDMQLEFTLKILRDEAAAQIWKDELLLSVLKNQNLADICGKLLEVYLPRMIFLTNTCCLKLKHKETYSELDNVLPFRGAEPEGYAWLFINQFLLANRERIVWGAELISLVIDFLHTWGREDGNVKSKTTEFVGKLGLYLYELIYNTDRLRYRIPKEKIERLQEALLDSAWKIKDELTAKFSKPVDTMSDHDRKLAERCVMDLFSAGQAPGAMPDMVISLMRTFWYGDGRHHSVIQIGADFGVDGHVEFDYEPVSAYRTPVFRLLDTNFRKATDFLIEFCNRSAAFYQSSDLDRKTYTSGSISGLKNEIIVYTDGTPTKQIASERLWNMHRGTSVGPNVLICALMGFESWLYQVVKASEAAVIVAYCRDIIRRSNSVLLTAVIVSVAEAFPDKFFDLICDFIETKEIFRLDDVRHTHEYTASAFLIGEDLFQQERFESNRLPHRQARLENIILNFQTNKNDLNNVIFVKRCKRLYAAMDKATEDIDTWEASWKFSYYKMDLRRYTEPISVEKHKNGQEVMGYVPAYTSKMKKLSRETDAKLAECYRFMDLELWSQLKFDGNAGCKKYPKYADPTVAFLELEGLWNCFSDANIEFERVISILSYTTGVLLRDFENELSDAQRATCHEIVLKIAQFLTEAPFTVFAQAANDIKAVVSSLLLLGQNTIVWQQDSPLHLLVALLLRDSSSNSKTTAQFKKMAENTDFKNTVIYLFAILVDSYEQALRIDNQLTVNEFLAQREAQIQDNVFGMTISTVANIPFETLSKRATFRVTSLLSPDSPEAANAVLATEEILMREAFTEHTHRDKQHVSLNGYIINYIDWLAKVLIAAEDEKQNAMLDALLRVFADKILDTENINHLLKWMISAADVSKQYDAFWRIWLKLMPWVVALDADSIRSMTSARFYGVDAVITTYLFGLGTWREGIYKFDLLPEKRHSFFETVIDKLSCVRAPLFAVSIVLNKVGKETYKDYGLDWLYKLISKNDAETTALFTGTMYYMEEYMVSFVQRHHQNVKNQPELTKKVQRVLEYMVNKGSSVAYFVMEQV